MFGANGLIVFQGVKKVKKKRCMERRDCRCIDVWEDEEQQPNFGGDEVMVAPPSNVTRMSRPPCTDGIHDDIARMHNIATISDTPVHPLPSDDTYYVTICSFG